MFDQMTKKLERFRPQLDFVPVARQAPGTET